MAEKSTSRVAQVKLAKGVPTSATIMAVPVFSDRLDSISEVSAEGLRRNGFTAKAGSTLCLPADGRSTVLVGVGDLSRADPDAFRKAAAVFIRAAKGHARLGFELGDALEALEGLEREDGSNRSKSDSVSTATAIVEAVIEGLTLGSYRFIAYKKPSEKDPSVQTVTVSVGDRARPLNTSATKATAVAEGVAFARDLVNEPGGTLTPTVFAERAAARARAAGLKVEIMDERAISKARLGGLLAVNRGSSEPPRLLKLTYDPNRAKEKVDNKSKSGSRAVAGGSVALVGKGITFDSGGLSIKPAESMIGMKNDMAGAAAVIAAMCALPALGVKTRVVSFTPMTDNMTGGAAQRPGDIYTARNGKTVEVLNTDAEGRLVLGEALVLASEEKPDAIVDLATLTGACVVALGEKIAGLMGNDEDLIEHIKAAADAAGERVWHLPLPEDYRAGLDSPVADIKNIGSRWGGTLTAGLFLKEFVGEGIKWAHLDIAGPASTSEVEGVNGVGATGFGVRLLVRLLQDWS